jgi:3'-5' exoribonuclease 1
VNFIIFDLEATCWQGRPPSKVQEIIEIGAVMVDGYGDEISRFNRFVRPILNTNLSAFCQELTSIRQQDVDRANTFADEDYLLCSWGSFDKKMLIQDSLLHKMETEWAEPHINLKQQYTDLKRLRKPCGLKAAVEREGFDFTGAHHRGIDDAVNLAKIFVKFLDDWVY